MSSEIIVQLLILVIKELNTLLNKMMIIKLCKKDELSKQK